VHRVALASRCCQRSWLTTEPTCRGVVVNLRELPFQAFVVVIVLVISALHVEAADEFKPRRIKAASGVTYTFFPKGELVFDFVVSRPAETQSDIYLCVPAAFTAHDDKVDGVYVSNGVLRNEQKVDKELGGAMIIESGNCKLLSTDKGKMLTGEFLKGIQKAHGSLFQQFLIVHECKAASFKDKSKFQRRAVYETTNGSFGIVESDLPITFSVFNDDLVALGTREALYCDMGAWDEGWYRSASGDKVVKIGLDRSFTNRQSNWLLLKAKGQSEEKKQKVRQKVRQKVLRHRDLLLPR